MACVHAAAGVSGDQNMNGITSLLGHIDGVCGQFAAALAQAQWQVYATISLVVGLSVLLFPPKNDPDEI
jgi:hypothetical protein